MQMLLADCYPTMGRRWGKESRQRFAGILVALGCLTGPPIWARDVGPETGDEAESLRWESVMPQPVERVVLPGFWSVEPTVTVEWGPVGAIERVGLAERLDRLLVPLGRVWRPVRSGEFAHLRFASRGPEGEGYALAVGTAGVEITAQDPPGRYYALVTLTQLLPPRARSAEKVWVRQGTIADQPRFSWRGLMVDSSRHFQSVETLEWVLELMALHKLNRFHWHLTDDQGWRLEVSGWPRLTSVGAWRTEADGQVTGGYYSADQVRHLVAFAARRHIVIVPEIDLPGHSSAALASYPELSASGLPRTVPLDWGVADGVLSIGRLSVDRFTDAVLNTLVELFPGQWIHWGGDEVFRTPWMRNAESLAWMRRGGVTDPDQALGLFWSRLAQKTLEAGRTPIGWDEASLHGTPPATVIQWWDDPARALAAFKAGHPVIASWKESSYLDYPEIDSDGDRVSWMPIQTLESIARHPFWPPGTPQNSRSLLLGLEAGLWTERAPETKLSRKLFPRLALVSELAWRGVPGGVPGWPDRIADHRVRLEAWGVGMPPPHR